MNILLAVFCVFLFSLTAPFTRLVALETTPEAIILLRILGAGIICLGFVLRDRWIPPRAAWAGLVATSLGSVVGFNSLMAYGLREVPAGHAAVALAGIPMATSMYSVWRDGSRPGKNFWVFAVLGMFLSLSFFLSLGESQILQGDVFLVLSVFAAAFGYVEGGRLTRTFGGARTMSWAVIITLPFVIPVGVSYLIPWAETTALSLRSLFSLGYLALVSQSLGMFLWFRVLSRGSMERVAQIQLLQPFMTLLLSILILGEAVVAHTWIIALLVGLCVFGTNRERLS